MDILLQCMYKYIKRRKTLFELIRIEFKPIEFLIAWRIFDVILENKLYVYAFNINALKVLFIIRVLLKKGECEYNILSSF